MRINITVTKERQAEIESIKKACRMNGISFSHLAVDAVCELFKHQKWAKLSKEDLKDD